MLIQVITVSTLCAELTSQQHAGCVKLPVHSLYTSWWLRYSMYQLYWLIILCWSAIKLIELYSVRKSRNEYTHVWADNFFNKTPNIGRFVRKVVCGIEMY